MRDNSTIIQGRICSGSGEGASFTQLEWAREQFIAQMGIEPHSGTLNLTLETPEAQSHWARLLASPGQTITPPQPDWCSARCYPVRIADRFPGAIVYPDVPQYPAEQIEIIAALPLRERLSLQDGDMLTLEISAPLAARAAIFDVDGTLVDSLPAFHMVASRAAAPHGIAVPPTAIRDALTTQQVFWEMLLPPEAPRREALIATMRADAERMWPDVLREHGRIFPGVGESLRELCARGLRLGIVTASTNGSFQPLRQANLLRRFGEIIAGKDVKRRKPDPEGLLRCAAALGVAPEAAVYVGDAPLDIQASRAAGMASVAVLSGAGDSALLSAEGPTRIIANLSHLPEILAIA